MSRIVIQNLYISAAPSGAPATIEFSPRTAGPQVMPPHMRTEKVSWRLTRGFDCSVLGVLAACTTWDIIFQQRG